jgi:aerobic-type carbon monoxide dehydrogenase small subunit (CoxS/CutS family)
MPTRPEAGGDPVGLRVRAKAGVERGPRLTFTFDGKTITAYQGESVAAALMAAGHRTLRSTPVKGEPRGVFCGMGVCFDCLVVVDGRLSTRACLIPAVQGMKVETQIGNGVRL